MSTLPPTPPPPPTPPASAPPPPPPPGGIPPTPLPWEMRNQIGFADAFVDTVKLFMTSPSEAWRRTRPSGDLGEALLFGVLVAWVGTVFYHLYRLFFGAFWLRALSGWLPRQEWGRFGGFWGLGALTVGGTVAHIVLAPIFIAIGLFVWAAILHLCYMIVGALSHSTAGFEGTFRVVAFSAVGQLAQLIPFAGGLAAFVWSLVLTVMGGVAIHRTTQGKALGAVLIPVLFCCACVVLAIVLAGAAAFSAFHHR